MPIEAKKVLWSSVVGQSVTLHDAETGHVVAQLSVRTHVDAVGDQDQRKCAGHVADWVVKAFEALARVEREDAHAEVMARIAEKQIA